MADSKVVDLIPDNAPQRQDQIPAQPLQEPGQLVAKDAVVDGTPLPVDICVVMDCTGSMSAWIDAARDTVLQAATTIRTEHPGALCRMAFVGYRDHGDQDQIISVPFNADISVVQSRIRNVRASGGNDTPEDVAGGLHAALQLEWNPAHVNIVLFVADAPAHGNDWHDITVDDRYPRGDPSGRCPAALVSSLAERQIDLTVFKCSSNMDTMVRRFHAAHAEGAARPGGAGTNANFIVLNVQNQMEIARSHSLAMSPPVEAFDRMSAAPLVFGACAPPPPSAFMADFAVGAPPSAGGLFAFAGKSESAAASGSAAPAPALPLTLGFGSACAPSPQSAIMYAEISSSCARSYMSKAASAPIKSTGMFSHINKA